MTQTRSQFALCTPIKFQKDGASENEVALRDKVTSMQLTIDALHEKCAQLEDELKEAKGAFQQVTSKVDTYLYALEGRFGERIKVTETQIMVKNKELTDRIAKLEGELNTTFKSLDERVNSLTVAVHKDVDMFVDVADLMSTMKEQEIGQATIKQNLFETMEKLKEVQKVSLSYKDALKSASSSSAPVHMATAPPVAHGPTPATRCIIKTPRGFIQGKSAMTRAQDFNIKVVSKLKLLEGHFSLPEATGMVLIEPKEGVMYDMWLAYFGSANDVAKMFAYKFQLKDVCPNVYVQPDLPKEIRMQRKLLVLGAKQFVQNQVAPSGWRFKWVDNLKILINGPAGAKRFVIIDEGVARVVNEGKVKVSIVSKGKEKKEMGEKTV